MGELNSHSQSMQARGYVIKINVSSHSPTNPTAEERKREKLLHAKTLKLLQQFVPIFNLKLSIFVAPKTSKKHKKPSSETRAKFS